MFPAVHKLPQHARRPLAVVAMLCVLALPCLLPANHAQAADDEVTAADLTRAQQRIAEARQKIDASRAALSEEQKRLRKAEQDAGRIAATLRQLNVQARQLEKTLARVQAERDVLAKKIAAQKDALARDARNAWLLGREQQLRLWLNADDPQTVTRIARYYEYFQRDRTRRLDEFRAASVQLAAAEARVIAEQAQLAAARSEQSSHEQQMAAARAERKKAVAALAADLRDKQGEMARRKADEAALKRLFSTAREAFRDVPPEAVGAPLKQRKGKLRRPVAGRLAAKFGSPLAEGRLTLDGIIIAAAEGSEVRAVHPGRVVFADWMRGYGQLVILDHGDGFLSVYGHNQGLTRNVGAWVQEGDVIASVGSSGGRSTPGLYFELRQGGEPQDPARWLRP